MMLKFILLGLLCRVAIAEEDATEETPAPATEQETDATTTTSSAKPEIAGKISGGKVVNNQSEFSYQGYLRSKLDLLHVCGCAILTNRHVLTAAHSINNTKMGTAKNVQLLAGTLSLLASNPVPRLRNALQINIHPKYKTGSFAHDLAVVEVEYLGNFDERVSMILLANKPPRAGTWGKIAGWGKTTEAFANGKISYDLNSLEIPTMAQDKCKQIYGLNVDLTGMFCAGYDNFKNNTNQGDEGSPLVSDSLTIGIFSWRENQKPGVYIDVTQYKPWILSFKSMGAEEAAANMPNQNAQITTTTSTTTTIKPPAAAIPEPTANTATGRDHTRPAYLMVPFIIVVLYQ